MSQVPISEVLEALLQADDCPVVPFFKPLAHRIQDHGIAPPDGYAIVPIEPTDEMKCAGGDLFDGNSFYWATECYKAMLAAAPKQEVKP